MFEEREYFEVYDGIRDADVREEEFVELWKQIVLGCSWENPEKYSSWNTMNGCGAEHLAKSITTRLVETKICMKRTFQSCGWEKY